MTKFATTADIRAVNEDSAMVYSLRFSAFFAAATIVDVAFYAMGLSRAESSIIAVMAAYLCTRPKESPRFRSLSRFSLAALLSAGLSCAVQFAYVAMGIRDSASLGWVVGAVFYTLVFGGLESLSFWWTCVVTPGRHLDDRAGG